MNPSTHSAAARVCHAGPEGHVNALPGILRKTMVHGAHTLLAEFKLARGAVIPLHRHPEEQTGYLVAGHLVLTIAGADHDLRPGDSWMIPGGIEHGARVPEDSVAVEMFSPVRADYLPQPAAGRSGNMD